MYRNNNLHFLMVIHYKIWTDYLYGPTDHSMRPKEDSQQTEYYIEPKLTKNLLSVHQ